MTYLTAGSTAASVSVDAAIDDDDYYVDEGADTNGVNAVVLVLTWG